MLGWAWAWLINHLVPFWLQERMSICIIRAGLEVAGSCACAVCPFFGLSLGVCLQQASPLSRDAPEEYALLRERGGWRLP